MLLLCVGHSAPPVEVARLPSLWRTAASAALLLFALRAFLAAAFRLVGAHGRRLREGRCLRGRLATLGLRLSLLAIALLLTVGHDPAPFVESAMRAASPSAYSNSIIKQIECVSQKGLERPDSLVQAPPTAHPLAPEIIGLPRPCCISRWTHSRENATIQASVGHYGKPGCDQRGARDHGSARG